MKLHAKNLLPSAYTLVGLFFLSIVLLLITNSHQLLTYYGLESSRQVIHSSTGAAVTTGLTHIDQFKFTDQVVTFLIWSLVGVFCFSVVRVIGGIYNELKYSKQLSSNKYVHPSTFSRSNFWRQITLEFALFFAGMLVSVFALYGLIVYILPLSVAYSRTFLIGLSPGDVGYLLIGLAIMYLWLIFLATCVQIVIRSRQLVRMS